MVGILFFLQFLVAINLPYSLAHFSKINTKFSFGYVPPSEEEYFNAEDESVEELVMPNGMCQVFFKPYNKKACVNNSRV